jgi:hypothetical protein
MPGISTAPVHPSRVSDQDNTSTGYFDLPSGTTAQRPNTPNTGMVRYNSSLGIVEHYNGSAWSGLGGSATVATTAPAGGTEGAFWLNSESGDLYIYAGGGWILASGTPGAAGVPGAPGAPGSSVNAVVNSYVWFTG